MMYSYKIPYDLAIAEKTARKERRANGLYATNFLIMIDPDTLQGTVTVHRDYALTDLLFTEPGTESQGKLF